MSFVAPYLLWLLPLAGIPLLFTWLNKQEIKTQDFPALHWLDDQLKSRLQRKNIRHWLQALWRVLILIVLIYTFARPVIGVQQKSISDTWVLVDNSPTMLQKQAGQTALEAGKQWLQENFKDLDDNLRLGQINPEPRWLGRYSAAPDLPLENIKINENQTNLTELQKWLAEQSPPEGTRIILITNGRQGLLPDTSPKANVPTLEITAPFSLLQTDMVTDGSLAEKSLFLGEEGQINWKTWPEKNVRSRLTINGNPVLSGARKANGATWEPEDSGFKKGVIELPGANPAWAGRWYFSFPVHEKVKIYFAGKSPAVDLARYLLAERIQTVQQPGEAQLILIGSRNYPEGFNELLPDEKVADIPRLVLLDKKFNRAEFTSLTAPVAFPWQIEGPLQFESPQPVSVTNRRQLLRSPLTKKARDLTIQQLFQVQPKNNDTILFKAGDKRLLARKDNWYILTVPPESFLREESISTVWPSVFSNIIFSAVKREGSRGWTTGQKQILPEKYNYPLQITTPDDSQVNVSSPGPFIPTKPGFYKIEDDSGEKYILAANRKRSPEDFKSFDPEKVGGNIEEFQGFAPRTAQPLTPWLWMTLLLMFGIDLYFTPE